MPVEQINIELLSGDILEDLQTVQFVINDNQQIWCLGVNFDNHGGWLNFQHPAEGVEPSYIGKLEDQGFLLENTIRNSLQREHWDFRRCANPECILLTKVKQ